jgi:hypothetical protein
MRHRFSPYVLATIETVEAMLAPLSHERRRQPELEERTVYVVCCTHLRGPTVASTTTDVAGRAFIRRLE